MAQHTILVEFYWLSNVSDILSSNTDDEIKRKCFEVSKYDTPEEALDAYAHTQAAWSTLLDDNEDYHKFIDEAYEHIKNHDFEWLCKHFV